MLKYLVLAILGTTVSAQCCDRRAPECQSRFGSCMTSTNGNFQQCDIVFCKSEPYPLPTTCCDQKLPECQMKFQECLSGTFGSFSLCSPTFCVVPDSTPTMTSPTRIPEVTTIPVPSIPELQSPVFTSVPEFLGFGSSSSCCNRTSSICNMAFDSCKREGGMFCESMFCDGPPMPSLPPTNFTCCDKETDMCQMMHRSCISSGGEMCDMMYCERSPLPSYSSRPTRKPKPSPRFSAFPTPKFLRPIPSVIPSEIKSIMQLVVKERKEIENITKIKEIQLKISCSLRMPIDNIKIKNITFIDTKGIRSIIKFNETDIDVAEIPMIDCMLPGLRQLQSTTNNVDIGYVVINPTPELLAYDPVNLVSSASSNSPSPYTSQQPSSSYNLATVLASVFGGALVVIGIGAMIVTMRRKRKPTPVRTQERVVAISVNPLDTVTSFPRVDSSRRQFVPQGSRM